MKHAAINEFKATQPKQDSKASKIAMAALSIGMIVWCMYQAIGLI